MTKKIVFLGLTAFVLLTALFVSKNVLAATREENRNRMAQELSEKLDVPEDKVQNALGEIREQRQAERQEEISSSLEKAVADKVITVEQKNQILQKMAENRASRNQKRLEMQKWFSDNGIDYAKIKEYIPAGKGRSGVGNCSCNK